MEAKKFLLTYEGLKKYEDELHNLKVVRREEVAQKINEARGQGDLSENAEYDAARDEQADIEARIEELEAILKNAEIVVDEDIDASKANIGCTVRLLDMEYSEEVQYDIVGSIEANSLEDKISNESPLGSAVIGHRMGDTVEVEAPDGVFTYKILDIWKTSGKEEEKAPKAKKTSSKKTETAKEDTKKASEKKEEKKAPAKKEEAKKSTSKKTDTKKK